MASERGRQFPSPVTSWRRLCGHHSRASFFTSAHSGPGQFPSDVVASLCNCLRFPPRPPPSRLLSAPTELAEEEQRLRRRPLLQRLVHGSGPLPLGVVVFARGVVRVYVTHLHDER